MKTRYILFSVLIGGAVLLSSCSYVLDKGPDGVIDFDEIFSEHDNVAAFLNTCYSNIHTKGQNYYFYENLPVGMSDDAFSSEEGRGDVIIARTYAGSISTSNHPMTFFNSSDGQNGNNNTPTYWSVYWQQIRYCNIFLQYIDEANVKTEQERVRWKAEAHLLRAFYYMELIKWYGKLPIADGVYALDQNWTGIERVPVAEVAAFIESDCNVALELPDNIMPWRITNSAEGLRVTKALAWALKSKAWLFAASPLHNEGEDHWEKAYQVNKDAVAALKNSGFGLYRECVNKSVYENFPGREKASAYHEYMCTGRDYSAAPNDTETIYQHTTGGSVYWNRNWVGSNMANLFKTGNCPTQELVDAYEVTDGSVSYPLLDLSRPYADEFHLQPNFNPLALSLYSENNPYANRDPRFYVTVMTNGTPFYWENRQHTLETFEGGAHGIVNYAERAFTRTGYIHQKFVAPVMANQNGQTAGPWKYYRLGELLLDLAEAAAEAGHFDDALAAANEVRNRVKMPPIPAGLSKQELILRIRNERRVEMAYEETRYFDLRRWQNPNGDLSETCKYFTAMWITRNSDGTFNYERRRILDKPRAGHQRRDMLLPLPVNESALIEGNVVSVKWQNPGW